MEEAVSRIAGAGAIPVTMGGDGAVTLPQLRALHRKYPDLAVLHIDAHTDSNPDAGYNTGTTFTRAAEECVVDPAHSLHVGMRGPKRLPGILEPPRSLGYEVVTGKELSGRGLGAARAGIRDRQAEQ